LATHLRRGVILAAAVGSLMLAGPAQAQDNQVPGDTLSCNLLANCPEQTNDQSNPQTNNQTSTQTNDQSVVVQQQQQQQGGGGTTAVPTHVVHRDRVVDRGRHFFVRPAARRRAFFVRGVALARTGFDAWMLGLAGVGCMAGSLALMARRRRPSTG
jgi:LPXTG-motif cell wall-anchored protein